MTHMRVKGKSTGDFLPGKVQAERQWAPPSKL
jgi:hypothetical protein